MTFQNEAGEVLDFDGDFAITKQAVSFFNSKIKGDFSINFKVDNNSVNRNVLGYDGPQMLNQVAYTRQPFTLMRNGNPFAKGFIVIQQDIGNELDCYFISGNSNWINLLNGLITELDYTGVTNVTDYTMQWSATNVLSSHASTGGIIFPAVDWCHDLNKGLASGHEYFVSELLDISADPLKTYCHWYPCFYLHTLVQEIAKQKNIKITGNVTENKLYQTLVLPPFRGEMKRKDIKITTAEGSPQTTTSTVLVKYTSLTESSDPESLFASAAYVANKSTKAIITMTVVTVTGVGGLPRGIISITKNTVAMNSITIGDADFGAGTYQIETSLISGDVIEIYFNRAVAGTTSITPTANLKIDIPTRITVMDFLRPDYFLPELSCLEIIKFVINFFGCSVYYDEYSKTLSIDIVESFKLEDAQDLSEYFQSVKTNYTTRSAANNYMRLLKSDDTEIKAYNKASLVKYGEGNITTNNTIKETNELMQIPFAATEFGLAKDGWWVSNLPLIKLYDEGDPFTYTAITSGATFADYEYIGVVAMIQGQTCRVVDDVAGDLGIFIVESSSEAAGVVSVSFYGLQFNATGTGRIYPQRMEYNEVPPRLLVVKPETLVADFSTGSSRYLLKDETFASVGAPKLSAAYAWFCKPRTGEPIDNMTANVALDNPDLELYSFPSVKDLYFNKISNLLRNAEFKVMMILPESVFQGFQFGGFIYLKTAGLTGYFWVDRITNYRDSNTAVEVTLLML